MLYVHEVLQMVSILIECCRDSDHQVRGHAVSSIGLLSIGCWMALTDEAIKGIGKQPTQTLSPQLVLECLITLCTDSVGTVRALAHKSLGEAVGSGCLHAIGSYVVATHHPVVAVASKDDATDVLKNKITGDMVERILVSVQAGCQDTKLAVRMQAMWSMGNLLLLILPYRLHAASEMLQLDSALVYFPQRYCNRKDSLMTWQRSWTHIDIWTILAQLCTNSLKVI